MEEEELSESWLGLLFSSRVPTDRGSVIGRSRWGDILHGKERRRREQAVPGLRKMWGGGNVKGW